MRQLVLVLILVTYGPLSDARKGSVANSRGSSPARQTPSPNKPSGFEKSRPEGAFGQSPSKYPPYSSPSSGLRYQPYRPHAGGFGGTSGNHFDGGASNGGHRTYYWGQEYYNGQAGEIVCSMPLQQLSNPKTITTTIQTPLAANQTLLQNAPTLTSDQLLSQLSSANDTNTECQSVVATNLTPPLMITSNDTTTLDQLLSEVVYSDGTSPDDIVWSCRQGIEFCCGTECCSVLTRHGQSVAGIQKDSLLIRIFKPFKDLIG